MKVQKASWIDCVPLVQERQKPSLDVQGTLEELEEELRGCYAVELTKGIHYDIHLHDYIRFTVYSNMM